MMDDETNKALSDINAQIQQFHADLAAQLSTASAGGEADPIGVLTAHLRTMQRLVEDSLTAAGQHVPTSPLATPTTERTPTKEQLEQLTALLTPKGIPASLQPSPELLSRLMGNPSKSTNAPPRSPNVRSEVTVDRSSGRAARESGHAPEPKASTLGVNPSMPRRRPPRPA